MTPTPFLLTLLVFIINRVLAHPGHHISEEVAKRAQFMNRNHGVLRACDSQLSKRGYTKSAVERRSKFARFARSELGLAKTASFFDRRDFASYNISHASNESYTLGVEETKLFADDSSCLLQPEVTQGPYYVDGELIRPDMSEDQEGVPLYLDIQLIDTSTCEPVPAVFVDLWHCNSTGVYSGIVANGNGDSSDTTNLDTTFLRGIQQSDSNGVVSMKSVFPGHYTGRATHIHVLAHAPSNTTVRTNSTLLGSKHQAFASHVGQLFFDQSLISKVEATSPYNTNTQNVTQNADDQILNAEADVADPFAEYVILGDSVSNGILAWIRIGIDPTGDDSVSSAATHYADYSVLNNESFSGLGSGSPPSGSGAPSGSVPSGAAPTAK